MRRQHVKLFSPAIGRDMDLIAYGDGGLPVLVFPTSEGAVTGWEDFGMINVLAPLLDAGKLRLYCVSSYDSDSWYGKNHNVPLHERAWRHSLYENWIMNQVVPAIGKDVGNPKVRLTVTGCSFGAFHSANFALKYPATFKLALCMSGVYDIRFLLDDYHDEWVYFNNPLEYVAHMKDDLLWELRSPGGTFIALVCGQGTWEDKCLDSTRKFWWLLEQKGIPNYMDLWGQDVAHDWPWWRKQIVFFMEHLVEGRSSWPNVKLSAR